MNSKLVASVVGVASLALPSYAGSQGTIARSACYELNAEASTYAGVMLGAIEVRWALKVIGGEPMLPPQVELVVGGETAKAPQMGLGIPEDTRHHEPGAMRFGHRSFGPDARELGIEVIATSFDHAECSVRTTVPVPEAPEVTELDLELLAEARAQIGFGEPHQKQEAQTNNERAALGNSMRNAVGSRLSGSIPASLADGGEIIHSAMFYEYVAYQECYWDISMFKYGPIDDWKLGTGALSAATDHLHHWAGVLDRIDDPSIRCLLMTRQAGELAMLGPNVTLSDALGLAREVCEGYPASLQMLDAIDLVARGELARNSHGWLENPTRAPKPR